MSRVYPVLPKKVHLLLVNKYLLRVIQIMPSILTPVAKAIARCQLFRAIGGENRGEDVGESRGTNAQFTMQRFDLTVSDVVTDEEMDSSLSYPEGSIGGHSDATDALVRLNQQRAVARVAEARREAVEAKAKEAEQFRKLAELEARMGKKGRTSPTGSVRAALSRNSQEPVLPTHEDA